MSATSGTPDKIGWTSILALSNDPPLSNDSLYRLKRVKRQVGLVLLFPCRGEIAPSILLVEVSQSKGTIFREREKIVSILYFLLLFLFVNRSLATRIYALPSSIKRRYLQHKVNCIYRLVFRVSGPTVHSTMSLLLSSSSYPAASIEYRLIYKHNLYARDSSLVCRIKKREE